MKAKMIVPHAAYAQGEIVRGAMADQLVEAGYAVMMDEGEKPSPKKAAKPKTKMAKGAPENKAS